MPLDIENGRFQLTAEARRRGATEVRWATYSNTPDTEAYWELRDSIYNDRSVWDLWKWPRAVGVSGFLRSYGLGRLPRQKRHHRQEGREEPEGSSAGDPGTVQPGQAGGLVLGLRPAPDTTLLRIRAKDEWHALSRSWRDTGSGKSVLITQILDQVWERGEPAIVYDPAMEFIPSVTTGMVGDLISEPARCAEPLSGARQTS